MARPRKFDEDAALQEALMVFWRHGYDSTTYRMLEKATGVKGRSLINVFGDKDAMFAKILRIYRERAAGVIGTVFETPSIEAIETMFGALTSKTENPDDIKNSGCLMVNTVFELGKTRDDVREEIDAYRSLWRTAFHKSLIASGISDADSRADFLLGSLFGLLSQIRLTGSTESVAPMAAVVIATVHSWKK